MNLEYIFKIVEKDEWIKSKEKGIYSGSSMDIKDGYIHFSEKEQIDETLKNYYSNKQNLILLKVDASKLKNLIWEQASNGVTYPHLYSTLDIKYVTDEYELYFKDKGTYKLKKKQEFN